MLDKVDVAAGETSPAVPFGEQGQELVTPEGIAILGSNPITVKMAPFERNWLIYACSPDNSPHGHSEFAKALPRVDQWFEIHLPISDKSRPYGYLRYVENLPFVWMRDTESMAHFPGARALPEKELKEIFGPFTFTSSIAFMLAVAVVKCCGDELWRLHVPTPKEIRGVLKDRDSLLPIVRQYYQAVEELYMTYSESPPIKQIGLWGIMQASQNEYAYQRPGIQNLIWEATKRGIRVIAPDVSKLFEPMPEVF